MPETANVVADLDVLHLVQVLGLAVVFAVILSFTVAKCARLMTDRSQYTTVFLALIPTMVLIISVVKSSLALSLGLVGALSIVRFRTPIKEPEELVYLFLAIAVGLGLGAGQILATSVCFLFITVLMFAVRGVRARASSRGVFIDVEASGGGNLKSITGLFAKSDIGYELRRFVDTKDSVAATYFVDTPSIDHVSDLIDNVKSELPDAEVTVLDTRRQMS